MKIKQTVTDVIRYYVNNILHSNNEKADSEERTEMDTAPSKYGARMAVSV